MKTDYLIDNTFINLKKNIKKYHGYARVWHFNIVKALLDEGFNENKANKVAARFMNNCFDIDTSKIEKFRDIVEIINYKD